jgi:pyridoxine 5-phosphate synthase
MTALSINLNKISLLRNSREGNYPNVLQHAQLCIDNGADGITVHPRPDQRHIRPSDVRELSALVQPLATVEFNVEGNPFAPAVDDYPGFIALVEQTKPDQCTLVPDNDSQLTSDHGFDLTQSGNTLEPIIRRLKDQGMRVSLFMDPDLEQIKLASEIGESLFHQHKEAAQLATSLGMGVNAGHDLNLHNLAKFASIPGLLEVSIGHAFIVDSLTMGMVSTVQAYKKLLNQH